MFIGLKVITEKEDSNSGGMTSTVFKTAAFDHLQFLLRVQI